MSESAVKASILVVDDEELIRNLLRQILERNGYSCTVAENAAEARKFLQQEQFNLILSDLNMPGESGIDFIRFVNQTYPNTATVMISAIDDPMVAETALNVGAYGYIPKPFTMNGVIINVENALKRRDLEIRNRAHTKSLEQIVGERTEQLQKSLSELQETMESTIRIIASIIDIRDPYTAGHQARVAKLALRIGIELGLSETELNGIYYAGMIHDMGKIAIPAEILTKPGKISDIEYALLKTHPQAGFDILKNMEFPWPLAQMVHQHHERMNGSGYPLGLLGDDILPGSRILCVADVVEAIQSHRPYRAALGLDVAMDEISKNSGTFYDTPVVNACTRLFMEKGFSFGQAG